MKKLIIGLFLILGLSLTNVALADDAEDWDQTAKLDAPNLVKISDNWYFGSYLEKKLDNSSADEDWGVGFQITYVGSIFDLSDEKVETK